MKTLTFVDANVLIAAGVGDHACSPQARDVLDDPNRAFASSAVVKLEVLPKAIYHKNVDEAAFYEAFFDGVASWAESLDELVETALDQAIRFGLGPRDALHVAGAISVGAAELVTTERRSKPMHRVRDVKIVSIDPRAAV